MNVPITIVFAAILLQGCAANMAASGQNGPDMNVVKRQQTREDVERMLGMPAETISNSNGEIVELYIVEARTEPSVTRAAGHATADLFTFGLWEFVGGPIEAYQGRRQRVAVRYDRNDRVLSIMTERTQGTADIGFR